MTQDKEHEPEDKKNAPESTDFVARTVSTICPNCGMKIAIAHTPNEYCPRFDKCSVNKCPLHPDYDVLYCAHEDKDGPGDPEKTCLAKRSTRETIAAQYPNVLCKSGLTDAEIHRDAKRAKAKAHWDALPEEMKSARLGKLAEARSKLPLHAPLVKG